MATTTLSAAEIAEKASQIATVGWCVLENQLPVWDAVGGAGWVRPVRLLRMPEPAA